MYNQGMRSKTYDRLVNKTPEDTTTFVRWYSDLVELICKSILDKGFDKLPPEEIPIQSRRFIQGDFDYSLRTIATLQMELGVELLTVNSKKNTAT